MSDHPVVQVGSHVVAGAAVIAGFAGTILPTLAAAIAAVWYLVQIYETKTAARIGEWFRRAFRGRPGR